MMQLQQFRSVSMDFVGMPIDQPEISIGLSKNPSISLTNY